MKAKIFLTVLTFVSLVGLSWALVAYSESHTPTATQDVLAGEVALTNTLLQSIPTFDVSLKIDQKRGAEHLVATMSLEEKIGQLFLARVPADKARADLEKYHLGGFLLFGRDMLTETPASLRQKIAGYQTAATWPLLIASDEEGGLVSRLSRNEQLVDAPFPSPQESFKAGGLPQLDQDLQTKLTRLNSYGIQLSLSPVADVSQNKKSFMYDRTLGQDVASTANYIRQAVTTMAAMDQGSTLKHFPGYGDNEDSHTEIVHDKRSLATLEKDALPPFQAGIDAGADSVLVSHTIVEALDKEHPASLSPAVYQLLRTELGFEGVIMTDDFDMAGLKKFTTQEEAAIMALKNGADLILSSTYQKQIPALIKAVKEGDISEEQLNASVTRIILLKIKLKLIEL